MSNQLSGKKLDVRIEIAPQIENYSLLERVVQNDPERVERVLKHKRARRDENQRQQLVRPVRANDIIDNPFRDARENDHRQRAENRAAQRPGRYPRIAFQVRKNTPDRLHLA